MTEDGFSSEYISTGYRSTSAERAAYWGIALGLQAVDGLEPSNYLRGLVEENIAGELDYQEVVGLLTSYYTDHKPEYSRQVEADHAAARINELYQVPGFDLSVDCLKEYHHYIFQDTMSDAGQFKKVHLWKREEILFGDTVNYIGPEAVERMLRKAIEDEQMDIWNSNERFYTVERVSHFTRQIWFTHPFSEGNTRTVAVFIGKYLNSLGFDVSNSTFKQHSLYYRNALVRASYSNIAQGIKATTKYLDAFYDNLLFNGEHQLRNRDLYVLELAPES
ncbi:MAG: Fic family protein [Coriobacteriia bacterium]|nr:Fic family protein [Coriobacteriia bacterium]